MKNKFSRREFLNLPGMHSGGHIVAYINNYDDDNWTSTDVHLSIADCVRSIDFDFDGLGDKEGRKNALHKVDTFIDVLTDFREALVDACKREKKLEAKRNAKEDKDNDVESE